MKQYSQEHLGLPVGDEDWTQPQDIYNSVLSLMRMHRLGLLGGETMPEDAHPDIPPDSADSYHYFTLPMALNYQRDSFALWRSATRTFSDPDTSWVLDPMTVTQRGIDETRGALLQHRLALQPNRHVKTWFTICQCLVDNWDGDIRNLFLATDRRVDAILDVVQSGQKKGFPYLSGPKISNYWLYVMDQYSDQHLKNRECLSVAPDTHVIQASIRLGLVDSSLRHHPNVQTLVATAWKDLLKGTSTDPIDVHTPLWLWSRSRFVAFMGED